MKITDLAEGMAMGRRVLALPMQENDAGADTAHGYLVALLDMLWDEKEGFSGKRPFGNSSWQFDLYRPLGEAGLIAMTLDADGYMEQCDTEHGDELIGWAIAAMVKA